MKLTGYGHTEIGKVRERNEDAYLLNLERPGAGVAAVADGLGGHAGGEIASNAATNALAEWARRSASLASPDLAELVESLNDAVFEAGLRAGVSNGVLTTLTLTLIVPPYLRLAHVGDSSAWILRNREITRLSVIHNVLHDTYGGDDKAASGVGNLQALTRVLGMATPPRPQTTEIELESGDRIVLLTDGITDVLGPNEIGGVLQLADSPKLAALALAGRANEKSGHDNLTAVVLHID
ncbi:MAG: serine/threonine-protein phosphatase [Puniceicoccaceae bacterium]|nr:MAG: serine/threonine-protein phosphatase [Puniceicoccaceae bacterium]